MRRSEWFAPMHTCPVLLPYASLYCPLYHSYSLNLQQVDSLRAAIDALPPPILSSASSSKAPPTSPPTSQSEDDGSWEVVSTQ